MTITATNPPAWYPPGSSAHAIWTALGEHVTATTLVHGSAAIPHIRGAVDEKGVIATMVRYGVLRPCKCDLAGADSSALAFTSMHYGSGAAKHIASQPWCTAFALLWTYTPGDGTPYDPDAPES